MSGREVLGCVAAVVSAFHTAADTLEVVKERKEKKKRKKEKEIEELVEIKLLHKSLVEVRERKTPLTSMSVYSHKEIYLGCNTVPLLQRRSA